MTEHDDHEGHDGHDREDDAADDDLRAGLRAADPARSLPPLTGAQRARAVRDATRDDTPAAPRDRSRLARVAVAAVAVLVLGGGAVTGVVLADDPEAPSQGAVDGAVDGSAGGPGDDQGGAEDAEDAGLVLMTPSGAGAARCMVPSAAVLENQDLAFAGTVTAADEESVTLQVSRWFRGPGTAEVSVAPVDPDLQRLLLAPDFVEGGDYLVSATGRTVSLCGFSGEDRPRLRALYVAAFG